MLATDIAAADDAEHQEAAAGLDHIEHQPVVTHGGQEESAFLVSDESRTGGSRVFAHRRERGPFGKQPQSRLDANALLNR